MSIPSNDGKPRKPSKKKNFSLDDFKKKVGLEDHPDKPISWYKCSKDFQQQTGLPGFPKGYVSLTRGFSNTGKSTAICEAAVAAQKDGDMVIIIDTENNLGRERLSNMGFDWDGNVIPIDNEFLLEQFGKKQDKNRKQAAIEDKAKCIWYFLSLQESGDLPFNLCILIDSIGTLDCIKTINAQENDTTNNNMWNAGAFEKEFKYMLNNEIPNSRKSNKPYVNTIIGVQKIWLDSMQGAGVVKHKGGEAFFYGSRLIFHFGGIQSHSTKKIKATSKGREVAYGIETKVSVVKNQIDGPLGGIALEGKIVSAPHGFISADKADIDKYKKEHISYFREALNDSSITADQIGTVYEEGDEMNIDDLNNKIQTL